MSVGEVWSNWPEHWTGRWRSIMQPGSVSDAGAARLRAPTTKLRPRPEGTKRHLSVCWPRLQHEARRCAPPAAAAQGAPAATGGLASGPGWGPRQVSRRRTRVTGSSAGRSRPRGTGCRTGQCQTVPREVPDAHTMARATAPQLRTNRPGAAKRPPSCTNACPGTTATNHLFCLLHFALCLELKSLHLSQNIRLW